MKIVFNNQITKFEEFIKLSNNQDFAIAAIGFLPKVCDNIKLDFKIMEDKDENRLLINSFQQFYIMYIFKKLEDYIKYFNYNSKANQNLYNTYIDFNFIFQKSKASTSYNLLVDYNNKQDILNFENKKYSGLITQSMNMCSKYTNTVFLYIFPMFLKWMEFNKIDIRNVYEWTEFLIYNTQD